MIVWGGNFYQNPSTYYFNTGGRYDPNKDSWVATSTTNAPDARAGHTAVWTGSEMIAWGGNDGSGNVLNTGGDTTPARIVGQPPTPPTRPPHDTLPRSGLAVK